IFAEYHPCRVEIVDKSSCLVSFASRADCVRMMIGMTKPLRRFRATRAAEDGELTDSDGEEEEGQIKQEKGDDVALVSHTGNELANFQPPLASRGSYESAGALAIFCLLKALNFSPKG
ncbi:hypothetical protein ANCDUO_13375, partial [Ancylostoma duodenale]